MQPVDRNESTSLPPRGLFTSWRPVLLDLTWSRLWGPAGFLVAYGLLEWISFIHEYKGVPITPWNPGLGVAFALMTLHGARYAAALFVGVLFAEFVILRSNLDVPVVVMIAAIITLGYALLAATARNNLRLDLGLNRLRDILVLLVAGAFGATIVAILLSTLLFAHGLLEMEDFLIPAVPLFVGDIIGIAVMTPLILRLSLARPWLTMRQFAWLMPEAMLYAFITALCMWIIGVTQGTDEFKFFYLLFLPIVVVALRYGLDGACIVLAVTQFGLVGLLHGYAYDAAKFTDFQTLMLALSTTGLVVGVTVTERRHSERALRQMQALLRDKEIEAAQAARVNLVSGMASAIAHEINQPMTAMRALARSAQQLIGRGGGDLTRAEANLGKLIAQIDHASGIVQRMREFLRRGRAHISTIDLRALLVDSVALVAEQTAAAGIRINIDVPADIPRLHGDRIQLQQIVLNLVRNAAEEISSAGQSGGHIRLTAEYSQDREHIEIGVLDNGPGVSDELAHRLFEPLTTSKREGLGLGLSICASIVEMHGGRIWLKSRAPGATEFRFSLPIQQPEIS